jgi:HAD superfamily hydrolase (TIGR01484 family)
MMPQSFQNFSNLYLMPTSGTQLKVWKGSWVQVYAEHLSPKEKEKIMISLGDSLRGAGYEKPAVVYGQLIEDRGSQITFSAVGQNAPYEVKVAWDTKREMREKIAALLRTKIPEYDVRLGGLTSIDITKRGINKAYAIRKLEAYLKMTAEDIVFVGDALFYGGNDYPAKATGVDCIEVKGPEDTKAFVKTLLA